MSKYLLSILIILSISVKAQTEIKHDTVLMEVKQDTVLALKYKLTTYMLSCQSLVKAIMKETDYTNRVYLAQIGVGYSANCDHFFSILQRQPFSGTLDKELQESITTIIKFYSWVFSDISVLNNKDRETSARAMAELRVALVHLDKMYIAGIISNLWKTDSRQESK
jgi:hypothetical protein